jgi:hypothetical protein
MPQAGKSARSRVRVDQLVSSLAATEVSCSNDTSSASIVEEGRQVTAGKLTDVWGGHLACDTRWLVSSDWGRRTVRGEIRAEGCHLKSCGFCGITRCMLTYSNSLKTIRHRLSREDKVNNYVWNYENCWTDGTATRQTRGVPSWLQINTNNMHVPVTWWILGRMMLRLARHAVTSHLLKFPWCFEYIFSDFYLKFSLTRTLPRGTKAIDFLRKEKKKVTNNA